jgi:hypothetical protein
MKKPPKITINSFPYRNNNIEIKSLRLQWGESTKSLGSFITTDLPTDLAIDSDGVNQQKRLAKSLLRNIEIKFIIKTTERIYNGEELNGFIEIYQLHDELMRSKLTRSSLVNPFEIIPSAKELAVHPWICACWGAPIEKDIIGHLWMKNIIQSGILLLGKKEAIYDYQKLNDARVMCYIINQYRKITKNGSITNITEFPRSAANPNIHIPRRITEDFINLYQEGWNLSFENPEDIVYGFSQLSIKDGFKLRAYQHSMGVAGAGLIYAIPSDSSLPEIDMMLKPLDALEDFIEISFPDDITSEPIDDLDKFTDLSKPTKPSNALDDFMEVIEGDNSPLSYLQAAICYHELHEFGAYWHSVRWGVERILPDEVESPYDKSLITNIEDLKEKGFELKTEELPETLLPRFYYEDGKPVITFYTINNVDTVEFIRYKHLFTEDGYTQKVTNEVLGTNGFGIMF